MRVVATQGAVGGVQITGAAATPTGSGGAQITFTLSSPASCEATVLNIAGRPVRTLASSGVQPAGTSVMLWDGRGSTGTQVPAGTYLVRITARSDDGVVTSALRNLRVGR